MGLIGKEARSGAIFLLWTTGRPPLGVTAARRKRVEGEKMEMKLGFRGGRPGWGDFDLPIAAHSRWIKTDDGDCTGRIQPRRARGIPAQAQVAA